MATRFHAVDDINGTLCCHYCGKEQSLENVKLVGH